MRWNNGWFWAAVLVVCLGALTMRPLATDTPTPKKEDPPIVFKSRPLGPPPMASVPIPKQTDYMDILLKVGSVSGAMVSIYNIIEKILKFFKKKEVT